MDDRRLSHSTTPLSPQSYPPAVNSPPHNENLKQAGCKYLRCAEPVAHLIQHIHNPVRFLLIPLPIASHDGMRTAEHPGVRRQEVKR